MKINKIFFSVLGLILLMLICLLAFNVGCVETKNTSDEEDEFGTFEGLSAKIEMQIIEDYNARYHSDKVEIYDYLGTYNDWVVVMMDHRDSIGFTGQIYDFFMLNTLFRSFGPIMAYKEGQFYYLDETFELGMFTREDLMSIAYQYHTAELNLENHAGLHRKWEDRIRNDYLALYDTEKSWDSNDLIIEYYGSYLGDYTFSNNPYAVTGNDHVVVMMHIKDVKYDDELREETIAGTLFCYSNKNRILLWKSNNSIDASSGAFYELKESYDLSLLTEEDIKSIAYYHETEKTVSYLWDYFYPIFNGRVIVRE